MKRYAIFDTTASEVDVIRKDFQLLSDKRLAEAQSLFRAKHYEGSYHLAGLAVECAVKACIAKQTRRFEFPDKHRANKSFDHNIADLVKVAGLQEALDKAIQSKGFAVNWNVVRRWQVESRYKLGIKRNDAEVLLLSITNPTEGVMSWLRIHRQRYKMIWALWSSFPCVIIMFH